MKVPKIRIWVIISGIIVGFYLSRMVGMAKSFQGEFNELTGENASLFVIAKSFVNQNFDSELEKEYKTAGMNQQYKHISIYYQEEDKELIPLTIETLKCAEDKSAELFGSTKNVPIDMIFMSKEDIVQISKIEDVSGYYSHFEKVLAVSVDPEYVEGILQELETPLYFFQKSILHEYAHYATFNKIEKAETFGDLFPTWFLEGISEYVGNDKTEVGFDSNPYEALPLKDISWDNDFHEVRQSGISEPYLQSYFTVNYLIQEYGINVVDELIYRTKESEDFYEALEQLTEKPVAVFEQDVINYYK
ncbi:hypothetical protein J7E38_14305 [Bacillus sp. ISL-35]|uniref:hypothetical protein n=1 Tax=Bacillus sp. ISL-35 TaxID=2819122 RepID=UPI001BE91284|nr:hypothetical protein [Bacillus sp. ISL-35]MBT2680184.1 hypothetical protein [Bacillus sp. ISL-35]MBT2704458.1 hypothetical protein [Chryseobacterium sp. ISL-80]